MKREIDLSISFFWRLFWFVLLFSGLFVLLKTDSERKDVEFFRPRRNSSSYDW